MTEPKAKSIFIIAYNYGAVKAGPVIRFMRYTPLFEAKGYKILFITRLREGEAERMQDENGINSLHISCSSPVELCERAIDFALKSKDKPSALLFLSLSYKNYRQIRRAVKGGLKCIYVSTMQLKILDKSVNKRLSIKHMVLLLVLRRLYNLMNTIVSSTQELQHDFRRMGISERKLPVIYNGVNTDRFAPAASIHEKVRLRNDLALPQDCKIILYVGLFVDRKGVIDLVETFSYCQKRIDERIYLLMVGHEMDMDENSIAFRKQWPELKQRGIDEGWLLVHPFTRNIDLYYKAADAFIFMSKLEGMPNVILESMSCGLPIFTTKFKGFSKDYGNSDEHYVELVRDVEVDGEKILELVRDNDGAKRQGRNARELAVRKFALSQSIDAFCKIFSE